MQQRFDHSVSKILIGLRITLAGACLALAGVASAAYPERPIRIVVPYAPGGSTDIAARLIAEGMGKSLGVNVFVFNQPGASGNIGASTVARSAGDGYNLLFAGNGIASAPSMKDVNYDLKKDLQPISRIVSSQFTILVNPNLKVNTLQEFLAYVRANPGKLNMACSGLMTAAHFSLEAFRQAAALDFVTIQFNGNAPAAMAMMSGDPLGGIDAASSARSVVLSGKLKALAVTGKQRTPLLPGVPTVAESGVPGFEAGFSLVMMAPSATPKPIIDRVYQAISAALKDPVTAQKLADAGYEAVGNTPAEYGVELDAEIKQNAQIIASLRKAGIVQ
jgi:tripartite-type tricarboxylate transporter receptor subunit TctC